MCATIRDKEVRRLEMLIGLLQSRGEEELSQLLLIERDVILQLWDRIENDLLRNLAHKWREPLNVISLMVMYLQESWEYGELDDQLMKQITDKIMEQVHLISKIIDDAKVSDQTQRNNVAVKENRQELVQ